jgi:hypothetical protein
MNKKEEQGAFANNFAANALATESRCEVLFITAIVPSAALPHKGADCHWRQDAAAPRPDGVRRKWKGGWCSANQCIIRLQTQAVSAVH